MSVELMPGRKSQTRNYELPIELTPNQLAIEESNARFKVIRAGRKFGKSTYAIYEAIKAAGKRGAVVWFIAPTYRQAKMIAWKEFKTLIPRETLQRKPNETELYFVFKNGAEIYVMGSDNPDSLRGPAPTHVVLEEAAMQKPEVWHDVIRPNLTARKGTATFITTPKGFNWFKDVEDQAKLLIAAGDRQWACFHFTIYDNPHIDRNEIEDARKSCDNEAIWRQEYMADFESSVGRVFNSFQDNSRHVRKINLETTNFDAYRGIDWGMRDNTGCVWVRLVGKSIAVYREHAENNLPPSAQAKIILEKTPKNERVIGNCLSHDAVRQDTAMMGLSVLWQMQNAGIRPIQPSTRDKSASRAMLQQLFQEDRILIDPSCVKLRKQLLTYEWKDTAMERTEDGNDDLVDALHYVVELLQTKLFLGQFHKKALSPKEMIEAHIKSEEARRDNVFASRLPSTHDNGIPDFTDTQAGYL